jgi:hypothetical protein
MAAAQEEREREGKARRALEEELRDKEELWAQRLERVRGDHAEALERERRRWEAELESAVGDGKRQAVSRTRLEAERELEERTLAFKAEIARLEALLVERVQKEVRRSAHPLSSCRRFGLEGKG